MQSLEQVLNHVILEIIWIFAYYLQFIQNYLVYVQLTGPTQDVYVWI